MHHEITSIIFNNFFLKLKNFIFFNSTTTGPVFYYENTLKKKDVKRVPRAPPLLPTCTKTCI